MGENFTAGYNVYYVASLRVSVATLTQIQSRSEKLRKGMHVKSNSYKLTPYDTADYRLANYQKRPVQN